ncbi:TetR/AcrR family transcriptional regulator [Spelaeicoccus albus]|uniref:AcrR family transcriptional regulator n=1 Tax=Spelaeicoccus albus TaxID=1280376 RepID=A0A7Z0D289_9MICO|nr:TetR/AcrR family transcriptional regulator [Spelaeicoccus albus]NYI67544.1 AcrR family transcriptional regulator [Spelaeicoccus albus]
MQPTDSIDLPDGLRERKKQARRVALRRAAVQLSLENGFANVTVEDICERCSVSPRTFFNYFASKEEAVVGSDTSIFDVPAADQFADGGPTGDVLDDFKELLIGIVSERQKTRDDVAARQRLIQSDPTLLQAQFSRMADHERMLRQLIERRLAHDSGSEPVATASAGADPTARTNSVDLLSTLGLLVMRAATERWRQDESHQDLGALIPTIFHELQQLFQGEKA